jgi:hypothetical protein
VLEQSDFRTVVIVHELLHLQVPNHGQLFRRLMKAYVPEWEDIATGKVSRACGLTRPSGYPLGLLPH